MKVTPLNIETFFILAICAGALSDTGHLLLRLSRQDTGPCLGIMSENM